jgi:hypothetical protein
MDPTQDIQDIWRECQAEIDANHRMAQGHQLMYEQTISNLAALRLLGDSSVEEAVKNL